MGLATKGLDPNNQSRRRGSVQALKGNDPPQVKILIIRFRPFFACLLKDYIRFLPHICTYCTDSQSYYLYYVIKIKMCSWLSCLSIKHLMLLLDAEQKHNYS